MKRNLFEKIREQCDIGRGNKVQFLIKTIRDRIKGALYYAPVLTYMVIIILYPILHSYFCKINFFKAKVVLIYIYIYCVSTKNL